MIWYRLSGTISEWYILDESVESVAWTAAAKFDHVLNKKFECYVCVLPAIRSA